MMPGMQPATAVATSNSASSTSTTSPASAKRSPTSTTPGPSVPGTSMNTPRPRAAATLGMTRATRVPAGRAACSLASVTPAATDPTGRSPRAAPMSWSTPSTCWGRTATITRSTTATSSAATAAELVAVVDLVIVAVRPQHVEGVLQDIGAALGERPVGSVAAGVTLARLQAALPAGTRVARVMPNVAAALGLGVFMLVPGTLGPGVVEVVGLFALAGDVVEVDEALFDAATAVAGCMPGIIAYLVEAFAAAGVAHGLAEDMAVQLAICGVQG